MERVSLATIAGWTGARVEGGPPDLAGRAATGVGTDSRTLAPGHLFVALSGDHFDGHRFVAAVAAAGAVAAVVERVPAGVPAGFPMLVVPSALAALQGLAAAYRRTLPLRVVGVTGSNGKTTAKEFAAAVLASRLRVAKTAGNLNNHIGVPLTLLGAGREHDVAVVEMGMNHPGEIAPLAALAAPVVGVITQIGVAHIEFMGTREAIAREKAALAEALPAEGRLILDADGDFCGFLRGRTRARVMTVGLRAGDLRGEDLAPAGGGTRFTMVEGWERAAVQLPVPGEHMVRNALLAAAVGRVFGVALAECAERLGGVSPGAGRLARRLIAGVTVLDDSYNANPDSMIAALTTLAAAADGAGDGGGARPLRVAVLGQMNELGAAAEAGHRAVGAAAAGCADLVVTVGAGAAAIGAAAREGGVPEVRAAADADEAAAVVAGRVRAGDVVLVKGSRGARMERVIAAFEREADRRAAAAQP